MINDETLSIFQLCFITSFHNIMISWRKRIGLVCNTISTVFLTNLFPPDRIVLNLSKDEFPSGYAELPENLISLINRGLEIEWVQYEFKIIQRN